MIKEIPFTFKKEKGRWKSKLNVKWFFELYVVYGIPLEMSKQILFEKTEKELELIQIGCWKLFKI